MRYPLARLTASIFISLTAAAQQIGPVKCTINGRPVSCDDAPASSSGSSGGYSTNSAVVQALSPALQSMFNNIGQSIANSIFGNPAEKARLLELQRQEQMRQAEEQRRRAAELKRRREEIHRRLMSELKLFESGPLGLKLDDELAAAPAADPLGLKLDDADLRPRGTAFFGLGGANAAAGEPPDLTPVPVIQVRRAAFLAEKALNASPADADFLMDEAMRVADGQPPFVAISDNAVPVVSERGLLAFQQANIDYHKTRSDSVAASRRLVAADREVEVAEKVVGNLRDAVAKSPNGDAQKMLAEAEEARRRLLQERDQTVADTNWAQKLTAWRNTLRRLALRATIDPDPLLGEVVRRSADPLDAAYRARLRDMAELYRTGSTPEEKLRARQALEKARDDARVELREDLKLWESVKEDLRRANERLDKDPRTAAAYAKFDVEMAAAEKQADILLRKGADLDDDCLFYCERGKSWPGPKDPQPPLPNPVTAEEKRTRLAMQILTRRAQQKEVAVLFEGADLNDPADFYDRVLETYNFRKFKGPGDGSGATPATSPNSGAPPGAKPHGVPGPRPRMTTPGKPKN